VECMWGDSGTTIREMCGVVVNKKGSPCLLVGVIRL
jgi:hypothetical protein